MTNRVPENGQTGQKLDALDPSIQPCVQDDKTLANVSKWYPALHVGILPERRADHVECVGKQIKKQELYEHLQTNYSSHVLPECENGKPLLLEIDIALRQILEIIELEQVLEANIWIRLTWTDCRLVWSPGDFDNITALGVLYKDVWQPDITLYDSASNDDNVFPGREKYQAHISSTGKVSYNFPTVINSICSINVRYFPFDTQTCQLKFASWSYSGLELDIYNKNSAGDTDSYIANNEWILKEFPVKRNIEYYNCCPEPYHDVTYYITVKRRPTFYVMTTLFPCILVAVIAGFTFVLPTESGEKVSLEITVLLSLTVFLLLVSEALPPSSENFPIIGFYFLTSMSLVTLSLIQTVCVVNLFYRGMNGRQVPRWVNVLFVQHIGRFLCVRDERNVIQLSGDEDEKHICKSDIGSIPKENTNGEISRKETVSKEEPLVNHQFKNNDVTDHSTKTLRKQTGLTKSRDDSVDVKLASNDWKTISNILDRLFLLIYTIVSIVTTVVFLVLLADYF